MEDKYGELIDDFLKGLLTDERQQEVEKLINTDEDFRKELEFRKGIANAFTRARHRELKSRLAGLAETQSGGAPVLRPVFNARKRIGLVAAALSFCVIGLSLLWFLYRKPSTEALYAAYFSAYPNVVMPLERSGSQPNARGQAYAFYEQQHYRQAYELFISLDHASDPEMLFYAGVSAMFLGQMDNAVRLLGDYTGKREVKLERQARWYLALALVKKGEFDRAKTLLLQLSTTPGYKKEDSLALLEKLE